jgi:plastocyanin
MDPKINNQNSPPETEVRPTPVVDVGELFQRDPVPVDTSLKTRLLAGITKNNIMIATVLLAGILMGGGLIYAGLNPGSDRPWTEEASQDYDENSTDEILPTDESDMGTDLSQDIPIEFGPEMFEEPSTGTEEFFNNDEIYVEEAPVISEPPVEDVVAPPQTTHSVNYSNKCYSPSTITIKKNEAVIFTNNSNRDMWPASDNHPSHSLYPEFDATGSISPGDTYTFTFTKIGTWGYHDHEKPSCTGTITVK